MPLNLDDVSPIITPGVDPEDFVARPPFITGSRLYGEPREDSDTDLVVFVTEVDRADLISRSDRQDLPAHYGKLNLIPFANPKRYDAWKSGTDICYNMFLATGRPVSREDAVAVIQQQCDKYGIRKNEPFGHPSGDPR